MAIIENLFTSGKEFTLVDGITEYIGQYHYHEDDAKYMVGPKHLHELHDTLYKIEDSSPKSQFTLNDTDSKFITELQEVSPRINEENIINDTIFELLEEDDLTKMFRLYDKLKAAGTIPPGIINRDVKNGVVVSNDANYKTHAYLIANSKNYMDGDGYMYSVVEMGILASQLESYRTKAKELENEVQSLNTTINSLISTINNVSETLPDFSSVNPDIYVNAFSTYIKNSLDNTQLIDRSTIDKYLTELNAGKP